MLPEKDNNGFESEIGGFSWKWHVLLIDMRVGGN
jgi:hypothetical protein